MKQGQIIRGAVMGGVGTYNRDAMNAAQSSGHSGDCSTQARKREVPRYADELDKMLAAVQAALEELEGRLGGVLRPELPPMPTTGQECEVASTSVGARMQQFGALANQALSHVQSMLRRLEL